jgi:arsenate reductase (glutaredoxin)
MSEVVIYHNPACGTSRNTLAIIRAAGIEPTVIEYLKTPPSSAEIRAIVKASGRTLRDLLREKGTPYAELDLANPKWSDEELLGFIAQYPILLNRPIVVSQMGTALCRPSEKVLTLLPEGAVNTFTKEDGEIIKHD